MSDCCCPDPKAPTDSTPSRSGGGTSLPTSDGATTGVQVQAGANGKNPDGTANVVPFKVDAAGRQEVNFNELPSGINGILANPSEGLTLYVKNGRILNANVAGGSGGWTFTPTTS